MKSLSNLIEGRAWLKNICKIMDTSTSTILSTLKRTMNKLDISETHSTVYNIFIIMTLITIIISTRKSTMKNIMKNTNIRNSKNTKITTAKITNKKIIIERYNEYNIVL